MLFRLLTAVALLVASTSVISQTVSSNLSLATDRYDKGYSQTDENPSIFGDLTVSFQGIGASTAFIGAEVANTDAAENVEANFFGGFNGVFSNGVNWTAGLKYNTFPGVAEDDPKAEDDFVSLFGNLGYTFSDIAYTPTLSASASYAPKFAGGDEGREGNGVYLLGSLNLSLPQNFTLTGQVGWQEVRGDRLELGFDNYVHYSVGVSKPIGPVVLSGAWHDATDNCGGDLCDAFIGSVSISY